MHYRALATDYDGTLAEGGEVRPDVEAALRALRESGRRLILVTGRELEDLMRVFPRSDIFDAIVAENGALLYTPRPPTERPLAKPPPPALADALRARGVEPLTCGRIILATSRPHEAAVLGAIRDLGLELEVIFNKDSVMVLPSGVNKATGLRAALAAIGVPASATVGIGDAENDHSLLEVCGLGAVVANAVPALAQRADLVMEGRAGDGVIELCEQILESDPEPDTQASGMHPSLRARTPSPSGRGGERG
jgi:hydroxymethylpyrimidine pyrophosphatase-like HAD family hydrolase